MHLSEFEKCEQDLKKLDTLLPGDANIKKLNDEFSKIKEEALLKKKKFTKKGLFNLYEEKEEKKSVLPIFCRDNTCFFLDIVFNDDLKNPKKIKFEIFNDTKIKHPELFNYLKECIGSAKWKNKEINNILDEIEIDVDYSLNKFPSSELYLLCLRRNNDINELIISNQTLSEDNILVLGRCYYNKECLSDQNRKFRILDCDYTYNI
jgi:hypothetical protein